MTKLGRYKYVNIHLAKSSSMLSTTTKTEFETNRLDWFHSYRVNENCFEFNNV